MNGGIRKNLAYSYKKDREKLRQLYALKTALTNNSQCLEHNWINVFGFLVAANLHYIEIAFFTDNTVT